MTKPRYAPIVALALLIAILGGGSLFSALLPVVPRVHAATDSVFLKGYFQAWNFTSTNMNPTITVHQGDTVSLTLQSLDGSTHQFLVDVDRDGGSLTDDCPSIDPCSSLFGGTGLPAMTHYNFPVNFAAGNYTYYCTVHFTSMLGTFQVLPDFSISASPTAAGVVAGGSSNFAVSLASLGFSGTVGLTSSVPSAATGVTASLTPSSIPLTSGGTGSSVLKVSTSVSSPSGSFFITVTGTAGQLSHTAGVMITITGGVLGGLAQAASTLQLVLAWAWVAVPLVAILILSVAFTRRRKT